MSRTSQKAYVNFLGPIVFDPPIVFEDGSVAVAGHVIVDAWGTTEPSHRMICVFAVPQVRDLLDALDHGQDVIEHAWSPLPWGAKGVADIDTAPPRVRAAYEKAMPAACDAVLRDGGTYLATGKTVTA